VWFDGRSLLNQLVCTAEVSLAQDPDLEPRSTPKNKR
jgi:hypothetical protein